MRDSIENISQLQKKLNDLQLENQILKNILDKAGLSYHKELSKLRQSGSKEAFDPEQGKRIIHPQAITENMANQFFSMFWGRQDVYAKRSVNKETGKAAYYPQCNNFWTNVCHKKIKDGINCKDCKNRSYKTITKKDILNHLQGNAYNASDVIGVYPLLSNGTCRFMVFDFDNHDKDAEEKDFANSDDTWVEEVESMREICVLNGIEPLVERSRSGRGAHVWIFFDKPIDASFVRKFGFALLDKGAEQINLKSFKYYDRMLPAQDSLPEDSAVGNLIALPLQGKALQDGNSAFIDGNWNAYPNQWETLFNKPRLSQEFLEEKIKEWSNIIDDIAANAAESDREKPWNRMQHFNKNDVEGKLHIILSNGIYVDNTNLKAAMQNRIRRMAAISNPVFYKNQAIGTSNYDTARWIYLGKDHLSGYIQIPRGLQDELWENIKQADIDYEMEDERQQGRKINVDFKGELRPEQDKALKELIKYDNGILHAATAFGKTVVSSAIIAQKKINTLIILESSALIEQWKEALEKFLNINEGLPTYETKTGRVRKRKSLIGTLQGAHDSMTGIIDIAMAGSLCKKGKYHKMMNEYGLVLIDECHHSASETIANVLKEVKAKYVYGVTATPKRGDGLEKINYMLIGPIRYSYTAKEKAKEQGIQHLVYPRFTRTVPPRGVITDKMHPNEAYEIIHNNDVRDEQIIEDNEELKDVIDRQKNQVKELFAIRLVRGRIKEEEITRIKERLQMKFDSCLCVTSVIFCPLYETDRDQTGIDALNLELLNHLPEEIKKMLLFPPFIYTRAIVMIVDGKNRDETEQKLVALRNSLSSFIAEICGGYIDMGVSRIFEQETGFRRAYNESLEALKINEYSNRDENIEGISMEDSSVTYYGDLIGHSPGGSDYNLVLDAAIKEAIDSGDQKRAFAITNEFMKEVNKSGVVLYEQHYYFHRFLLAILSVPADAGIPIYDLFPEGDEDLFLQFNQLYDSRSIKMFYETKHMERNRMGNDYFPGCFSRCRHSII